MNKKLILTIASMGIFVEALDIAIVNLALPEIGRDLGLADDSGYKLQSLYVLMYGCCLIPGGKLSDYIGRKTIFLSGCTLFMLTSLGAGLSHSFHALLVFRAFQGLGAALLMPSAFAIVNYYFSAPQERSKAIGIFGSFAATGSAGGLSVGGIIATYWGWSWLFLINVPILCIIIVIGYFFLEKDERRKGAIPDIPAALALVLAMLSLSWITEMRELQTGLIAVMVLLGSGYFLYYRLKTQANPLLDVKVLSLPSLKKGNVLFILLGVIFTGYLFIMSFLLQQNFHFSAAKAGLIMMPFSVLSMLMGRFGLPLLSAKMSTLADCVIGCLWHVGGFPVAGIGFSAA